MLEYAGKSNTSVYMCKTYVECTITGIGAGEILVAHGFNEEGFGNFTLESGEGELINSDDWHNAYGATSEVRCYLMPVGGDASFRLYGTAPIILLATFKTGYPVESMPLALIGGGEGPSHTHPAYRPYADVVGGDFLLIGSGSCQRCGQFSGLEDVGKTAGTAAVTRLVHGTCGGPYHTFNAMSLFRVETGGTFSYCGFSTHYIRLRATELKQYMISDSNWTLG